MHARILGQPPPPTPPPPPPPPRACARTHSNREMRRAANTGFPSSLGCLFLGMPPPPCGSRQDPLSRLGSEARVATWQPQRAFFRATLATLATLGTGSLARLKRREWEPVPERPPPAARPNCRRASPPPTGPRWRAGEGTPFHFLPLTARLVFPRRCERARGASRFPFPCSGPQVPAASAAELEVGEGGGCRGWLFYFFFFLRSLLQSRIFSSGSHLKHSKDAHHLHFRRRNFLSCRVTFFRDDSSLLESLFRIYAG